MWRAVLAALILVVVEVGEVQAHASGEFTALTVGFLDNVGEAVLVPDTEHIAIKDNTAVNGSEGIVARVWCEPCGDNCFRVNVPCAGRHHLLKQPCVVCKLDQIAAICGHRVYVQQARLGSNVQIARWGLPGIRDMNVERVVPPFNVMIFANVNCNREIRPHFRLTYTARLYKSFSEEDDGNEADHSGSYRKNSHDPLSQCIAIHADKHSNRQK